MKNNIDEPIRIALIPKALRKREEEKQPDFKMYDAILPVFSKFMRKELAANWEKGDRTGERGWLNVTDKKFWISELYYHVGKLQSALMTNDTERIKENTADIANLSLMVLDVNINLLESQPAPQPEKTEQTAGQVKEEDAKAEFILTPKWNWEVSDTEMLDWLQSIMTDDNNYCEVFFAGLRNGTGKASAFQIESNPIKFETLNGKTVRDAITLAMGKLLTKPEAQEQTAEGILDHMGIYRAKDHGWVTYGSALDAMNTYAESQLAQYKADHESMIDYILGIDWLGTKEFCEKYDIPVPYYTGEVKSSADQFIRIEAIKSRMFIEHAKKLRKEKKSVVDQLGKSKPCCGDPDCIDFEQATCMKGHYRSIEVVDHTTERSYDAYAKAKAWKQD